MTIRISDFNPFYSPINYGKAFTKLNTKKRIAIGCVVALTSLVSLPLFALLGIATFRILTRKFSKAKPVKNFNFHIEPKSDRFIAQIEDLFKAVTQKDRSAIDKKLHSYMQEKPKELQTIYEDFIAITNDSPLSYNSFLNHLANSTLPQIEQGSAQEDIKLLYMFIQAKLKVFEEAHLIKFPTMIHIDDTEEEYLPLQEPNTRKIKTSNIHLSFTFHDQNGI